jgi:purine-binding chemotaxis protein CheW
VNNLDFLDEEELYYSTGEQYFLFYAKDQIYAIDAKHISEIVEYQAYTKVPNLQSFVLGVTNIRGHIIGVVDFLDRCGLGKSSVSNKSSFVVVRHANQDIALLVDEIYEVDGFSDEMKKEKLSFGTEIESRFIKNIVIYRNQNVFLLNLDELLKLEELSVEVNNG